MMLRKNHHLKSLAHHSPGKNQAMETAVPSLVRISGYPTIKGKAQARRVRDDHIFTPFEAKNFFAAASTAAESSEPAFPCAFASFPPPFPLTTASAASPC